MKGGWGKEGKEASGEKDACVEGVGEREKNGRSSLRERAGE